MCSSLEKRAALLERAPAEKKKVPAGLKTVPKIPEPVWALLEGLIVAS
jgi:hypothetical protein